VKYSQSDDLNSPIFSTDKNEINPASSYEMSRSNPPIVEKFSTEIVTSAQRPERTATESSFNVGVSASAIVAMAIEATSASTIVAMEM